MKSIIPLLVILLAFMLPSCYAPRNIVKLQPSKEPTRWLQGQAFVGDSLYGISYEIGFDKIENGQYLFDFHITNRSNMPILVDPANFYYCPYDGSMNPLEPEKVAAIDPESELTYIDKELSKNEAQRRSQFGVSLMAIGADIASGIIIASDDNPHNDMVRMPIAEGVHAAIAASAVDNEFETEDLNDLRQAWSSSTIRKTTLSSNYRMYGKVFFPASPGAAYIRLYVPVDDELIAFTFQQLQIPVTE